MLNKEFWQKAFVNLAAVFEAEKLHLCQLDGAIGDGDHGASMARGFAEAAAQLSSSSEPPNIARMFQTVGNAFLNKVGGVTGVIFGTFFIEAGKKAEGLDEIDAASLAAMLDHALESVKKRGKAKEGDKSMIDALAPAVAAAKQLAEKGTDMETLLESAAESARQGMEATKEMPGKVGRVRYQKEKGVGHIDAGAVSIAVFFRTLKERANAAGLPG
jgi:phosphoenolpyruvate---glycerone phosphotransferase subunit DhaL